MTAETPASALLVALGAAAGAPLRFLVAHWLRERCGTTPAVGTLVVNIIGSLILGLTVGAALDGGWLALIGTGFCGAFTTFSTLSLELQAAFSEERSRHAVAGVVLHLVLGVGAAWLGVSLTA